MPWKMGRVPTPPETAREMMHLAKVGIGDVVYDLGCGEGNIVIAAAQMGAQAVGVEQCSDALAVATRNADAAGVRDRVRFLPADLHSVDFSDATVLALYLIPSCLEELKPKIFSLRPGSRVISHSHDMGDWPPDNTVRFNGKNLHCWVVPGKDDPPRPPILTRTLEFLLSQPEVADRRIRELYLNNHYTIVELDDGRIGASVSDYSLGEFQLIRIRHQLLLQLHRDPLLLRATEPFAPAGGVAGSICAAVTERAF